MQKPVGSFAQSPSGYGDIYPIGWGSQLLVIVQMITAWGYNAMCDARCGLPFAVFAMTCAQHPKQRRVPVSQPRIKEVATTKRLHDARALQRTNKEIRVSRRSGYNRYGCCSSAVLLLFVDVRWCNDSHLSSTLPKLMIVTSILASFSVLYSR